MYKRIACFRRAVRAGSPLRLMLRSSRIGDHPEVSGK